MDSLLQDLKDKLNITWDEEDTERKLNMIIEDAKLTLNYKLGYSIDYSKEDIEHSLFLDYCMYAYNNCINEFDDNYFNARSMDVYITKLRKHLKEDDSIEIINIHGKGYKLITPEVE